jgi:hypothetical protein
LVGKQGSDALGGTGPAADCELCLRYPVNLYRLRPEAPRMPLPLLYCIVGTLYVNALYFAWGRCCGPSAAAGDTEREQAASREAALLARVWPLAVAGVTGYGAASAHAGGAQNAR